MRATVVLLALGALLLFALLGGAFFTVSETETAIVTQFGRPVGDPITEAGLHWKTPFVQDVHRIEKRVLECDGPPTQMPTKDKTYIEVDTFARWRIVDPATYFVAARDERSAQSRLEDIIGSEVRSAVAAHELIEVVRSDKSRVLPPDLQKQGSGNAVLPAAKRGRLEIEADIKNAAAPKLHQLGIELLDVRLKRVNYAADVLPSIYNRMKSERLQIAQHAQRRRGEAARILGKKERDLREVESIAYKQVQQTRGAADAEATRIYAEAYDRTPESRELFQFLETLKTYQSVIAGSSLVLSTDSDLFRLLKQAGR